MDFLYLRKGTDSRQQLNDSWPRLRSIATTNEEQPSRTSHCIITPYRRRASRTYPRSLLLSPHTAPPILPPHHCPHPPDHLRHQTLDPCAPSLNNTPILITSPSATFLPAHTHLMVTHPSSRNLLIGSVCSAHWIMVRPTFSITSMAAHPSSSWTTTIAKTSNTWYLWPRVCLIRLPNGISHHPTSGP